MHPVARSVALAAVVGIAAAYVALGATHQWDFETYYHAASAFRAGLNPYDAGALGTVAGRPVPLPFLYPPITLFLFLPFTYVSMGTAAALWLALKVALAAVLVWIWWREFLRPAAPDLVMAVSLVGFNLALLWDLRTGNVALLEEALLWLAFSAYVRGRLWIFVALVALASSFKIYPILFLGLVLLPAGKRPRSYRLVASGVLLLLALVFLPVGGVVHWMGALGASLGRDTPGVAVNSSVAGIVGSVFAAWGAAGPLRAWLSPVLYGLYCVILLLLSGRILSRSFRDGEPRRAVIAAVLLWLLLAPRAMVYSYVMAVVPALVVVRTTIASPAGRGLAIGLLLLPGIVRLMPGSTPSWVGAMPFLLVLWLWSRLGRSQGAPSLPSARTSFGQNA